MSRSAESSTDAERTPVRMRVVSSSEEQDLDLNIIHKGESKNSPVIQSKVEAISNSGVSRDSPIESSRSTSNVRTENRISVRSSVTISPTEDVTTRSSSRTTLPSRSERTVSSRLVNSRESHYEPDEDVSTSRSVRTGSSATMTSRSRGEAEPSPKEGEDEFSVIRRRSPASFRTNKKDTPTTDSDGKREVVERQTPSREVKPVPSRNQRSVPSREVVEREPVPSRSQRSVPSREVVEREPVPSRSQRNVTPLEEPVSSRSQRVSSQEVERETAPSRSQERETAPSRSQEREPDQEVEREPVQEVEPVQEEKKKPRTIVIKVVRKVEDEKVRFIEDRDLGFDLATFAINDEVDHSKTWRFEPMYKQSIKDQTLMWAIGFDVETDELLIFHGISGKKIQLNRTKVVLNQSGRTMEEQSLLEARQKRKEKFREGYYPRGEVPSVEVIQPMLANKWIPGKTRITYAILTQAKYDGVRCLASLSGSGVAMRSRQNRPWSAESQAFFEDSILLFMSFLPSPCDLDGEIFGEDLGFEKIVSVVKDTKKMKKYIENISYNIFTYADRNLGAGERCKNLERAMKMYIESGGNTNRLKLVETKIANNEEEVLGYHRQNLLNGYEGTMLYSMNSPYTSSRTNALLKYKNTLDGKEMYDEEGVIVDYYVATGVHSGCIMFVVEDPRGNKFKLGFKASLETRRQMYANRESYIHQLITYKYQELTAYGVPKFATGISIRDYE
jgi:hypothetical protein